MGLGIAQQADHMQKEKGQFVAGIAAVALQSGECDIGDLVGLDRFARQLRQQPSDPLLAASDDDGGGTVYKSTDGGATWRRADVPTGTWFDIAFDMDTPLRIFTWEVMSMSGCVRTRSPNSSGVPRTDAIESNN